MRIIIRQFLLVFVALMELLACNVTGSGGIVVRVTMNSPAGLSKWDDQITWKLRASFFDGELEAKSGETLELSGRAMRPGGDWLLCRGVLSAEPSELADSGLPDLGWTSACERRVPSQDSGGQGRPVLELQVDGAGGLAAAGLEMVDRAGADWSGLNLVKLDQELMTKGLDSVSADVGRLFGAISDRDISVYDLVGREHFWVAIAAEDGDWLDCRGQSCRRQEMGAGRGRIEVILPLGASTLFRADGKAFLRVWTYRAGDGAVKANAVEHACR